MAIEVELPDGTIVEFPDGTDNATMERALQQYAAPRADFGNVRAGFQSTEGPAMPAAPAGLAPSRTANAQPLPMSLEAINAQQRQVMGSGQGQFLQMQQDASQRQQQQAAYQGLPMPLRAAYGASKVIPDAGMGGLQMLADATGNGDAARQWEAQRRQEGQFAQGDSATTVGNVGGQIAAAAVPFSRIGQLGRAGQYAASAGVGATQGALQPVVDGESRALNTGLGGLLGAAGQGLADGVMASGRAAANAISPELRQLAQYGESIGLPLTGADLAKTEFVRRLASMTDNLPFSGAAGRQATREAATGRQVAKLIGQDADTLNQGVMADAYRDMGRRYDEFFAEGMKVDQSLLGKLNEVTEFAAGNLDDTAARAAANFAERVRTQIKDGQISGDTLQSLDQQARKLATGGGDRQTVMMELREALHDAFGRQSSAAKSAEWRRLNQQYANYKTIEPVVARNPQGISADQLMSAVNSTGRGKARMARGEAGDIGNLALLGAQMRKPRTSKTPEGLLPPALGIGIGLEPTVGIPLAAGANVLGRFLNSRAAGLLLLREGRGKGRQAIAPLLRPAGLPAGGLLSEEWLQDSRQRP